VEHPLSGRALAQIRTSGARFDALVDEWNAEDAEDAKREEESELLEDDRGDPESCKEKVPRSIARRKCGISPGFRLENM
jgi:hypothetical protein